MIRITLRVPEELHKKLSDAVESGNRPMNREIIQRLEDSFQREEININAPLESISVKTFPATVELKKGSATSKNQSESSVSGYATKEEVEELRRQLEVLLKDT